MCSGAFRAVFTVLSTSLTIPLVQNSCFSSTSSHGKKMDAEKADFLGGGNGCAFASQIVGNDVAKPKLSIPHFSFFYRFFGGPANFLVSTDRN